MPGRLMVGQATLNRFIMVRIHAGQHDFGHQATVGPKKARFCLLSVILFGKVSDRTLVIQHSFLPLKILPFGHECRVVR